MRKLNFALSIPYLGSIGLLLTLILVFPRLSHAAMLNIGETKTFRNSYQVWMIHRLNTNTILSLVWDWSGPNTLNTCAANIDLCDKLWRNDSNTGTLTTDTASQFAYSGIWYKSRSSFGVPYTSPLSGIQNGIYDIRITNNVLEYNGAPLVHGSQVVVL